MSYGPPPGGYGPPPGPPPGGYGPPPGPPGYGGPPAGAPPFNWLVPAILLIFPCCNLLFGIPAVIFATQVNSKWAVGDYHGAHQSAKIAMILTLVGFGLGVVGWGFYGITALANPYYYY